MNCFPLVSIVIPVYNGTNYLRESIESALSQTYPNIEILVVNDGSTDNGATRDLAKSYGKKIRYFEKVNGGVSTALNLGIRNMSGEYFSWLSHDDVYHPENISRQIKNILSYNELCVSACSSRAFEGEVPGFDFKDDIDVYTLSRPLDHWKLWIYACSILVPKKVLLEIGCLNESNKTTQDTELVWEILRFYKIYMLKKQLVFRRTHGEQGFQNPSLLSTNLQESSFLVKRKINAYGVKYFLGRHASRFEQSMMMLYLASKYARDKRRFKYNDLESIRWLIDQAAKLYPGPFSPASIVKALPVKCFCRSIFFIDTTKYYMAIAAKSFLRLCRLVE